MQVIHRLEILKGAPGMTDLANINVSTEGTVPAVSPNYPHAQRCLLSVGTSCPPETTLGLISTPWLPPEGGETTGPLGEGKDLGGGPRKLPHGDAGGNWCTYTVRVICRHRSKRTCAIIVQQS